MDVSKNQLVKNFSLLERDQILRMLYFKLERNPKAMIKPQKVLFDNPSILYATGYADKGKVRESFLSSMMSVEHELAYPKNGDLLVDRSYLFDVEVQGKRSTKSRTSQTALWQPTTSLLALATKSPLAIQLSLLKNHFVLQNFGYGKLSYFGKFS